MKITLIIFSFFLVLSIIGAIGMYIITDKEKVVAIGYFIYTLMLTLFISFVFAMKELRLFYLKLFGYWLSRHLC